MTGLQELTYEINRIVTASYDVSLQVSAQHRSWDRAQRCRLEPNMHQKYRKVDLHTPSSGNALFGTTWDTGSFHNTRVIDLLTHD
jgi:hypothetical protein